MSRLTPAAIGVRFVTRVVHDVEADRHDGQRQQDRERHGLPPRRRDEHQQHVDDREGREDDRGLDVHFRTVAFASSGVAQVRFDPLLDYRVERIVAAELQASERRCGRCKQARGARCRGRIQDAGSPRMDTSQPKCAGPSFLCGTVQKLRLRAGSTGTCRCRTSHAQVRRLGPRARK